MHQSPTADFGFVRLRQEGRRQILSSESGRRERRRDNRNSPPGKEINEEDRLPAQRHRRHQRNVCHEYVIEWFPLVLLIRLGFSASLDRLGSAASQGVLAAGQERQTPARRHQELERQSPGRRCQWRHFVFQPRYRTGLQQVTLIYRNPQRISNGLTCTALKRRYNVTITNFQNTK